MATMSIRVEISEGVHLEQGDKALPAAFPVLAVVCMALARA